MHFVNLTPHPINVYRRDSQDVLVTLHPQQPALRLEEKDERATVEGFSMDRKTEVGAWAPEENYFLGAPVYERSYSAPDLPKPKPNTCFVVSLPALMGLRAAGVTRADLLAPDTGTGAFGAVRDDRGQVLGVRAFVTLGPYNCEWTRGKWWDMVRFNEGNKEDIERLKRPTAVTTKEG